MICLVTYTVRIDEYNIGWQEFYEKEKLYLHSLIGQYEIDIQHVGSTSINGCSAKPIIDIAIGIPSLTYGESLVPILVNAGYVYKGDDGIEGRHYFKRVSQGLTVCHIHMEPVGGKLWNNHIIFRDYLKTHPDVMKQYIAIKKELARKYPDQRDIYAKEKSIFIEQILKNATMNAPVWPRGN